MIDTLGNVLTWALCGGILVATLLIWLYVFVQLLWSAIRGRQEGR
jgi:hypothetical protein